MQAEKLKDGKRKPFLGNSLTIKTKTEMKKNLFMVAAVALFAAVSCNDQLSQDVTPAGETVTFEASVDGADTKVSLEGKVSKWENGDKITIHNGTKGYEFSTTDAGTKATFSYTGADFSGEKFMAVYPSGNYTADVEARTVTGYIPTYQPSRENDFSAGAVPSVAYSETQSLSFKNAATLLKFTIKGTNVKGLTFYGNNGEAVSGNIKVTLDEDNKIKSIVAEKTTITESDVTETKLITWAKVWAQTANYCFNEGVTYYLAVVPQNFEKGFTAQLEVDGVGTVDVKKLETAYELKANTIVDLGELEYVAPSVEQKWGIVGTMTSWGSNIAMDIDGDWYVAKNVVIGVDDGFKFRNGESWADNDLRTYSAGKAAAGVEYALTGGAGENNEIKVATGGTYDVYLAVDLSKFKLEAVGGSETPEVTPGEASPWSVSGTFNSWGDLAMVTTTTANVFVAANVKLDAYASFKVRKDKAWTENYGGGIVYMIPNNWVKVYSGGSDISITEAGTYDLYFDYVNKRIYAVTAGADYTTVSEQTKDGPEPKQEEPEVTEKVVYLKPNSNWTQSNARFAAYFWGGTTGEKWVSMTAVGDGTYMAHLPEGYDYGCNIIFCRMNPSTSANNWNNKWNQTSDLKTPTDGKNLYTVKDSTWDKGGGTWSVK